MNGWLLLIVAVGAIVWAFAQYMDAKQEGRGE